MKKEDFIALLVLSQFICAILYTGYLIHIG